jgi:PPOX class probable F420-dependent enzyme
MEGPERDLFLREPETAVLGTIDRRGRVHNVPVWFRWDGEAARVVTGRDSVKVANIRRTGRASLCVDRRGGRLRYVTMEGPVEIIDPLTMEERLALRSHYQGKEAARAVVEQGGHEDMVLLILRPETWITMG